MKSTPAKKRTCNTCGKLVLESKGVLLLRGITFACKPCYTKQQRKNKNAEVCEFC